MRFRTDSWGLAGLAARLKAGDWPADAFGNAELAASVAATPPAEPGDVWRLHWNGNDGPVAGYAIGCPKCGFVHPWTSASNCTAKSSGKSPCDHAGISSCWTWTGSAEAGTLTAEPSLHATGACGWHGFLRNGELTSA